MHTDIDKYFQAILYHMNSHKLRNISFKKKILLTNIRVGSSVVSNVNKNNIYIILRNAILYYINTKCDKTFSRL